MREVYNLTKKELFEIMRTRKFLIIFIIFIITAITSVVTAKLTPEILKNVSTPGLKIEMPTPTYKDSVDQFVKNTSQLVVFVLIFVAAGAVSDERVKRTMELLVSKPVGRANVVLSKFAAYLLAVALSFVVAAAGFYYYTVSIFSSFSLANFAIICGFMLLFILWVISATIFGSTISKNNLGAAGIGFLFLFGTSIAYGLLPKFRPYFPSHIMSVYPKVLLNGMQPELWKSFWVGLFMIVAFVLASVYIFKNQEIDRS